MSIAFPISGKELGFEPMIRTEEYCQRLERKQTKKTRFFPWSLHFGDGISETILQKSKNSLNSSFHHPQTGSKSLIGTEL